MRGILVKVSSINGEVPRLETYPSLISDISETLVAK
jgi:hypothetical protein